MGESQQGLSLGMSEADEIAAIYAAAPIGLSVLDRELRYVRINDRLAEINGLPASAHIGRTVADIVPDLASKIEAQLRRVLNGESLLGVELVGETAAQPGVQRVWRENWIPLRNGTGAIIGISISTEEITAERQATAALESSMALAKAALAEKEQLGTLLAVIGETSPDLIYAKDRDGRLLYGNPAVFEVLGRPATHVIGRSEAEWGNDPEEARVIREIDQRIMRSGRREIAAESYTSPGGQRRFFRSAKSPIFDPSGKVVGLAGVSSDVTEMREVELAAARAAADFQAIAENVSQLVWMAEPDGHIFWYNRRWYEYTGTSLEDMRGWGWQKVHHPSHVDRVTAEWGAKIALGERYEGTFPLRGANGQYRWFLTRAEPIRDEAGAIHRWFGTNTDVTDQIETAEALSRSEAQFRTFAEALPGMLFIATKAEGNTYVNPGYQDFTGLTEGELLGYGFLDAVHPDDRQALQKTWDRAVESQAIYEGEFRFLRHDGAARWHLVRGLPVRRDDGAIERWVGACINIHERIEAEHELQRRVEQALAERQGALAQLHEAQKLETIGQLTGGVAHDFNNLLTPIVGSLDLLRRRAEDERSIRWIEGALGSAERARTLIQRLLAFARRQTLQPQAVDVAETVTSMRELVTHSLGPLIAFEATLEPDLPPALIDPNQLELALLNLSVNARDAMPHGGMLHWIVAHSDGTEHGALTPGRFVRIAVRDSGVGMDADMLARAVEPFFTTKPAGKGTGLGLSMVHGLAAQSGGAFRLDSKPGEGTTATLWLPVADGAARAPARDVEPQYASQRALVMLVDDEEQVRFTTEESLIELGYDVVAFDSAQAALDAIGAGLRPDLLVTDHLMPGMTGAQLAIELRRQLPRMPVLMVTGYAQLRPEEAGGLDVLVKPYRHAELALRIADLLAEQPVLQRTLS